MPAGNKVITVIDDLFFTVKILDAAKRAGLDAVFVQQEASFWELVSSPPSLIIIDLNIKTLDAIELIGTLKANPATAAIELLAFISHVQVERKQRALDAGANTVLPRSVFSTSLPAILGRHGN